LTFYSFTEDTGKLSYINANNGVERILTIFNGDMYAYYWTPDGTKIALWADYSVFVMNNDGSNKIQINPIGEKAYNDSTYESAISPDGRKLMYMSIYNETSGVDCYIINIDGSNKFLFAHGSYYINQKYWLPDSKE
jgi:Tol biopolymer transport system component